MLIRAATPYDVPAVCALIAQLGHIGDTAEIAPRLDPYLAGGDMVVLLAVIDGRPVGVACGAPYFGFAHAATTELTVLVVDESARGQGVGKALLAAFEAWVRGRGGRSVKLGSRATRKDAHRFYEREGYTLEKVHHIYRKQL